ncbi:hypothetical protein D3C87_1486630 [compost metagenome]
MDSTISNHFHNQFLIVSTLLNTGILDRILNVFDWRKDRVDSDEVDCRVFWTVLFSRNVTTTFTDMNFYFQSSRSIQVTDHQIRGHYLKVRSSFTNHCCSELLFTFDYQGNFIRRNASFCNGFKTNLL